YKDFYHAVRINYYPPRGDAKEGWDNIDIFGWLGYPMQIKIDFLCRDSILAAPLVLDLVLFLDLAHRAGMRGIQEWLSFYFKPRHDLGRRVKNLVADRNDAQAVKAALAGKNFEVVFDNVYDWDRGTTAGHVEATVRAAGDNLHRYIFMSSVAAYGDGLNHHEG